MKKAFITGGSGFLGNAIVNRLSESNIHTVSYDLKESSVATETVLGNILDVDTLNKAMKNVDYVFHIAGMLGTSELIKQNNEAVKVNILGSVNVFESARKNNVNRVFYPTKPNEWLNTYSITKKSAEDFSLMFDMMGFFETRILRWLNAYGPMQKTIPVRKAVPMMIVEALENKPLTIL